MSCQTHLRSGCAAGAKPAVRCLQTEGKTAAFPEKQI